MKKFFAVCGILVLLVACGNMVAACDANSHRYLDACDIYALTTVVVDFDYENDIVYCQDFNGEVWAFDGIEDWVLGDIASLTMYNSGTEIIYDDEIINVKYCGWFDGWEW